MGILGGSSSPAILLIGGITTSATGPNAPIIHDQKMAGFSCDAQRRYRIGEPQNVFGTAAAMVIGIVELEGVDVTSNGGVQWRLMAASGSL